MLGDEEAEALDAGLHAPYSQREYAAQSLGVPSTVPAGAGISAPLLGTQQAPASGAGGIVPKIVCAVAVCAAFGSSIVLFTRLYDKKLARMGSRGSCQKTTCPAIYVVGGCSACSLSPSGQQWQPALQTLESYDPATAAWNTTFPPLPSPRAMLGLGVVNDKIYAVGGIVGGNATVKCSGVGPRCLDPGQPSTAIDCFDPSTRQWGPLKKADGTAAVLPYAAWGMAVADSEHGLYIIGGFSTTGAAAGKLGVPTAKVLYLPVVPNAGSGVMPAKPMVSKGQPSPRAFAAVVRGLQCCAVPTILLDPGRRPPRACEYPLRSRRCFATRCVCAAR